MTDLATTDERRELAGYGLRDEINEMVRRIKTMVPNANKMDNAGVLALAQVSVALSLNPITGEVWAIPQKGGTYAIMAGIKGLRKAARVAVEKRDKNGTYYIDHRLPTEDEIKGVTINEGDFARACDCYILTDATIAMAQITGKPIMFTGLGIFRAGERTKMEHVMVARKRAEADALKQAFDLSALTGYQPEPPEQWQLDNQARDEAPPYTTAPRGRDELFKTEDPRPADTWHLTCAVSTTDKDRRVYLHDGGEVVSSEAPPGVEEHVGFEVPLGAEYEFYDRMLDAIRYFESRKQLLEALGDLGMGHYHPGYEDVMQQHLEQYATEHANAEAAAEQGRMM